MTRKEICNTLCDVLINQFTGETSLQVIDCHSFFIIKGATNNESFVELSNSIESFEEINKIKKISYFDLITYTKDNIKEKQTDDIVFSISSEIRSN